MKPRGIRLFVSSTFRDMQWERDVLAADVFPQIRRECEGRGGSWREIDLRWGVPAETPGSASRTVKICLEEIDNCQPFFICMLGARYGWVDWHANLSPDTLAAFPWLAQYADRSVTELEVIHGALSRPDGPETVFFYFRAPEFIADMGPDVDLATFQAENAEHEARQSALKEQIRTSPHGPSVRTYRTIEEFRQLVLRDLDSMVKRALPVETGRSQRERLREQQLQFARARGSFYCGREEMFHRLNATWKSGGPPLVVAGPPGAGKSTLLATWLLHGQEQQGQTLHLWSAPSGGLKKWFGPKTTRPEPPLPEERVLCYFAGARESRESWRQAVDVLAGQIETGDDGAARAGSTNPEARFSSLLHNVCAEGPALLIIDGIDQITGGDPEKPLLWFPESLPANLRVVLSASDPRVLNEAARRKWSVLQLAPLESDEKRDFADAFLALYGKNLDPLYQQQVAGSPQTRSPLFLRVLLEELRVFGFFEGLSAKLKECLECPDVSTLYDRMLARLEHLPCPSSDFNQAALVSEAFCFLWCARSGLSESELADLLGTAPGLPAPAALLSPLLLASPHAIYNLNGLLKFHEKDLFAAVERRYLADPKVRATFRRKLVDYLAAPPWTAHKVAELPWQLAQLADWPALAALLADPAFLAIAWSNAQMEVRAYWRRLQREGGVRVVDVYSRIIEDPSAYDIRAVLAAATLLFENGNLNHALSLTEQLEAIWRSTGEAANRETVLNLRAAVLKSAGQFDAASALYDELETAARQTGDQRSLASALGNKAVVLHYLGRDDEALALHREEEGCHVASGDVLGRAHSLGNQATLLFPKNAAGALQLYREQERCCRLLGDLTGLLSSLRNQGRVLIYQESYTPALAVLKEAEDLSRKISDRRGLAACLGQIALGKAMQGDYDGALECLEEEEKLVAGLADHEFIIQAKLHMANVYAERLHYEAGGLRLAREALELAKAKGFRRLAETATVLIQRIGTRGAR